MANSSRKTLIIWAAAIMAVVAGLLLAGCKKGEFDPSRDYSATIETEKGTIVIDLHEDVAPKTVANFVKLANEGFYDGLTFHRVIPGFVAQGGDPKGDGSGGPGYTLEAEISDLSHEKGTVAMARKPDEVNPERRSSGSQFYICLAPQPHLDGQYTIFGQVTEGMETVLRLTVAIVHWSSEVSRFARYGLPGVFIISLLGNATLILPAPSLAVVFAMGAALPPIQVGLVAGAGGALGELTGYLAGYAGSAVIVDRARYERIQDYMARYGVIPILVLAIIPSPFFDLAGIAAGTLKMPLWRFLLPCWVGKSIKMVAFAYAGAGSISFLSNIIRGAP